MRKLRNLFGEELVGLHVIEINCGGLRTLYLHIVGPVLVIGLQSEVLLLIDHELAELTLQSAEKVYSALQFLILFLEYEATFLVPSGIDCVGLVQIIVSQDKATVLATAYFEFYLILSLYGSNETEQGDNQKQTCFSLHTFGIFLSKLCKVSTSTQ